MLNLFSKMKVYSENLNSAICCSLFDKFDLHMKNVIKFYVSLDAQHEIQILNRL